MPNAPGSGLPNPASYTLSGDTVLDNVTGLRWQRAEASAFYKWADAKAYCETLSLGGMTGWRLPSSIELVSLVDYSKSQPAIDTSFFPGTSSDDFWSSSEWVGSSRHWYVKFDWGFVNAGSSDGHRGARCVHGSPTPPAQHYTIASGIVTDNATKLQWQQAAPSSVLTWANAKTYCSQLVLNGTGWRLPTAKELRTIVDVRRVAPAIDLVAFPNAPDFYFWSSSAVAGSSNRAWNVYFIHGATYSSFVGDGDDVRCVR